MDAWQHSLSERAVQAGTLAVRLSHLAATARSDDGLVEVTVNTSGVPTEVRLGERVRDHPAAWIAERILAAMPGGEGIEVDPAALLAHATSIEPIASAIYTAQQAGNTVRMDKQAYGKLCVIAPALLDVLQDMLVDGIAAAAESVHDSADRLRKVAGGYQASDIASQNASNQVYGSHQLRPGL